MITGYEKTAFLHLPTPLEYLPTLSRELKVEFYVKRDDLTHPGMGGNKLRKLEYLLKDAQSQGATMLMTVGGVQTNHGRLTAAVAAKFGMKCAILSIGEHPDELSANMLLSRLLGADVIVKSDDGRPEQEQYEDLTAQMKRKYETQGERVYLIPMGGSNEIGFLGYYECAKEISAQALAQNLDDARIFTAVGSMGTFLGLYCGLRNENAPLRCTGIAILPFDTAEDEALMDFFHRVKKTYALRFDAALEDFDIRREYTRGGYNNASAAVRRAIRYMAEKEAIFLDPCYTGKCFAGMLDMIEEGKIKPGEKVILVHTGGFPGIYTKHHRQAFEEELMGGVYLLD